MSPKRALEVRTDDHNPQKWQVSLTEEALEKFISQGGDIVKKIFGEGSLFSPFLFGKFFDPGDAFPLWEFESEALLSKLRSASKSSVDWAETDGDQYILKAELPVTKRVYGPGGQLPYPRLQQHISKGYAHKKNINLQSMLSSSIAKIGKIPHHSWFNYSLFHQSFMAFLAGGRKIDIEICVEKGKVVDISGQWKVPESDSKDWKTKCWWEHGFVRRLELPDDANWRKIEVYVENDSLLEIKVPKNK